MKRCVICVGGDNLLTRDDLKKVGLALKGSAHNDLRFYGCNLKLWNVHINRSTSGIESFDTIVAYKIDN